MLNLKQLTLRRGNRILLDEVDLIIKQKQRVGLIGANGCGKSSLFALFLGNLVSDKGDFTIQSKTTVAHLAQETPALTTSAIDYVIDGDREFRKIQQELLLAEKADDGEKIAKWHEQLEAIGGYQASARAGSLLHGLGFSTEEHLKSVAEFSGGWRMRLNLAQTLMCRSDLLLLDEPTNHLDLDALLWLERWLLKYPGTLIMISHDRDFLDNVVTHIIHIEKNKLNFYTGNYSGFERLRAEKLALQKSLYEKQVKQRAHLQKFIDRFRAKASKASQAQSRMKMLEKLEVIAAAHVDTEFNFQFKEPKKLPRPLIKIEHAAIGYGERRVVSNINLILAPGDRIGILGPNGAGKSTLIKLIADVMPVLEGTLEKNPALKIGYFAQHQLEQLDFDKTPLEHLQLLAHQETIQQLRDYLGGFGFSGDQALTKVATFSGGEKARLVLALIVWQRPNLLLLDEPTNHFDIEMREALTLALQDYQGALIVVSHDRHLLRSTTDELLLVYAGKLQIFNGNVDDYQSWLLKLDTGPKNTMVTNVSSENKKELRKAAAQERESKRHLVVASKKIESEMDTLDNKLKLISEELSQPEIYDEKNKDILVEKLKHQAEIKQRVTKLEEEWLQIQKLLEA